MSRIQPDVWKVKLLEALERSLGIVTPACKEVGISRDRFYTYYNEDPEFKKKVDDIQNIQLDFVENQLFRKIKDGSERSIIFYMKHRGKSRGYRENIDLTTDGDKLNSDIKVVFVDGNNGNPSAKKDDEQQQ